MLKLVLFAVIITGIATQSNLPNTIPNYFPVAEVKEMESQARMAGGVLENLGLDTYCGTFYFPSFNFYAWGQNVTRKMLTCSYGAGFWNSIDPILNLSVWVGVRNCTYETSTGLIGNTSTTIPLILETDPFNYWQLEFNTYDDDTRPSWDIRSFKKTIPDREFSIAFNYLNRYGFDTTNYYNISYADCPQEFTW